MYVYIIYMYIYVCIYISMYIDTHMTYVHHVCIHIHIYIQYIFISFHGILRLRSTRLSAIGAVQDPHIRRDSIAGLDEFCAVRI